jgi:hypothetical protein
VAVAPFAGFRAEVEMSFQNLLWLFPVAITLHNAEEAIWFPAWTQQPHRWFAPVAPGVFRFAVTFLTILAYLIAWLSATSGKQTVWTYLVFGCMVVTLANAFVPHIAISAARRSYMPGVATAVVIVLPTLSLLVWLALKEGYVSGWKAVAYSLGVSCILLLFIPALFKLGKVLKI